MASSAAIHDLPVAKQILEDHVPLKQGRLYADKAYIDAAWKSALRDNHAIELITPRKKRKEDIWASGDTFSSFVSSHRLSESPGLENTGDGDLKIYKITHKFIKKT